MSTDTGFPELRTARLRLREIVASDAPALLAIHGDHDAMRWFGTDPLSTLAEAEQVVENFAGLRRLANPGLRWGLELIGPPDRDTRDATLAPGQFVGTCGFFKWNRGWRVALVGYELARAAQGRGFMSEALRAVCAWAFEMQGLERVEAQVHPDNTPSLVLLRRLGFVQEGLLREAGYWLGARRDLVQLGLLRQEFVAA